MVGKLLTIKMVVTIWGVKLLLDGTVHIAEGVEKTNGS